MANHKRYKIFHCLHQTLTCRPLHFNIETHKLHKYKENIPTKILNQTEIENKNTLDFSAKDVTVH